MNPHAEDKLKQEVINCVNSPNHLVLVVRVCVLFVKLAQESTSTKELTKRIKELKDIAEKTYNELEDDNPTK